MALSRTTSPEGHDAMSSSDLSQPDTEPLPFDEEEEEEDQDADRDEDGRQESQVEGDGDGDQEMVDGEDGDQQHNPQSQSQADAEIQSESELENQNGSNNQIESNQSSPLKATTAFTQDEFSGSDLTDPNDDDDDDEEDEDQEEDSEDDQAEKSRGRAKGKWNKANRRQREEEEEEEEGEDGDGLQDQSPQDPMESATRNNSEDQEGVEGGEGDDEDDEDRNSNSSRDSSNYDSEDPTSINSNRLRRATRSRAPINSNRGKKNGATGTRKSKPRRSSGRSSGDGGGGASNIPSGAVPVTLTNPNNKSSSSSTTNTTTGTRGRGRGRGRGSRGRGRGANSSSRGGANAANAGNSTREGTAATDPQQETDLETNAEDENEDEDLNVEGGGGGGSGKRRRVSSEDEAEGLDGLAALATTTTASNNNNGANGKIKGRSSRGMSGGMGMLANAPQISIVGGDDEEEQAEDLLSASARTSREVSMNPDALLEDLQAEAEARENEEGVRKLKGQKTNDQDSSRKDSSSLDVVDPSIANVDGTSPAIGGTGASTSAAGAGTGIGEVEETGGLMADSDLAAQHRQEALEQLTKIEIMFAKLRDRLYIERMEELRKEAEMVLEGTHPDLIKLTNIIENQRDNRLKLVEAWLEKEEICVEEMARADEESSWSSWRNDAVELRRTMMDETARKKRRLDREKRTLDVPRPTRRYQAFEAELTPNPRFDPSTRINETSTTSSSSRQAMNPTISRKKAGKQRAIQPMEQETEYQMQMELDNDLLAGAGQVRAGEFVAYPGLRGLESNDVWNDLETMGIAPLPAGYSHNLYSTGVDPYSGGATNGYYYEEPQVSSSNPYEPYPSYEANRAPPPRTSNSNINVFGPDHPSHHAFVGNHQPIVPPRTNQDHPMDRDLEREREREREREMLEKERERERIREKRERDRVQQQHSTPISSSSSSYLTNGNGNQSSRMSNQQMTSSFSSSHPNQLPPPPPPPPTSSLKAGSPTNHLHQHPHSSSAHNGRDLNGQMEIGH